MKDQSVDNDTISQLVSQASEHLKQNYKKNEHHVASALRCGKDIYLSLHLDTKGFDVCAEPIALSKALEDKQVQFDYIVAVIMNDTGEIDIVSPCGNCRQMLLQYCPTVKVILRSEGNTGVITANELLPYPY
jgi:cytidine deaminase